MPRSAILGMNPSEVTAPSEKVVEYYYISDQIVPSNIKVYDDKVCQAVACLCETSKRAIILFIDLQRLYLSTPTDS